MTTPNDNEGNNSVETSPPPPSPPIPPPEVPSVDAQSFEAYDFGDSSELMCGRKECDTP